MIVLATSQSKNRFRGRLTSTSESRVLVPWQVFSGNRALGGEGENANASCDALRASSPHRLLVGASFWMRDWGVLRSSSATAPSTSGLLPSRSAPGGRDGTCGAKAGRLGQTSAQIWGCPNRTPPGPQEHTNGRKAIGPDDCVASPGCTILSLAARRDTASTRYKRQGERGGCKGPSHLGRHSSLQRGEQPPRVI